MTPPTILIAGIGNIFFGDDAFGTEVARRLLRQPWPEHVRVADFGIRSLDLVYALIDGYDVTILIDAIQRGEPAGTISVIEPDLSADGLPAAPPMDGHTMDPVAVLALAQQMGAPLGRVLLVGCEPQTLACDDGHLGCSEPVAAAFDEAARIIHRLVSEITSQQPEPVTT